MAMATPDSSFGPTPGSDFPPTHWSMVMNAGRDSSPDARAAFGRLYSAYRPALLAFLRRMGRTEHEAEDLINGFFEFLLEDKGLSHVQRTGKFRAWLLTCLKHYVFDLWDKQKALKRGGGQTAVPLAAAAGEEEHVVEPPHPGPTPDEEYERHYAFSFLQKVMTALEEQYRARGRADMFQHLHPYLLEKKGALSHSELGRQLGMKEENVSQEISRLRRRYRETFDQELLNLVGTPEQMEEEKRFLFQVLNK